MRNVRETGEWFVVLETVGDLQTAAMTLQPGEASGPKMNEHPGSEQLLYVVEGELEAEIGDRAFTMRAGDSAIVPKGVEHRFVNRSSRATVTLNAYTPPAY